jgi:hypothetical protein
MVFMVVTAVLYIITDILDVEEGKHTTAEVRTGQE